MLKNFFIIINSFVIATHIAFAGPTEMSTATLAEIHERAFYFTSKYWKQSEEGTLPTVLINEAKNFGLSFLKQSTNINTSEFIDLFRALIKPLPAPSEKDTPISIAIFSDPQKVALVLRKFKQIPATARTKDFIKTLRAFFTADVSVEDVVSCMQILSEISQGKLVELKKKVKKLITSSMTLKEINTIFYALNTIPIDTITDTYIRRAKAIIANLASEKISNVLIRLADKSTLLQQQVDILLSNFTDPTLRNNVYEDILSVWLLVPDECYSSGFHSNFIKQFITQDMPSKAIKAIIKVIISSIGQSPQFLRSSERICNEMKDLIITRVDDEDQMSKLILNLIRLTGSELVFHQIYAMRSAFLSSECDINKYLKFIETLTIVPANKRIEFIQTIQSYVFAEQKDIHFDDIFALIYGFSFENATKILNKLTSFIQPDLDRDAVNYIIKFLGSCKIKTKENILEQLLFLTSVSNEPSRTNDILKMLKGIPGENIVKIFEIIEDIDRRRPHLDNLFVILSELTETDPKALHSDEFIAVIKQDINPFLSKENNENIIRNIFQKEKIRFLNGKKK